MLQSKLFGKTQKQPPKDEVSVNAQLLTQAGFIDKLAAGIYSYLPLGLKVLNKIKNIVREEMEAIGGQEILLPALTPKANWQTTGRWNSLDILFKLKGAGDKDFALGPTHEEIVTPLAKKFINSYKDLPVTIYQIQDKFRNEPRAKSGLLRGREFSMKDFYSFHQDQKSLEEYYEKVLAAYLKIFARCGLDVKIVEASGGSFSHRSHEFQVFTPYGEDIVFSCPNCGINQNREIAVGNPNVPEAKEDQKKMEKVAVKRGKSVKEDVALFNLSMYKSLKNVVYKTKDGLLAVAIRGDLSVSDVKLAAYLNDFKIRMASDEELKKAGLVPGFISPVKNTKLKFIADNSITTVNNFLTGANEIDKDYINANLGVDFEIKQIGDFAEIISGYTCQECNHKLVENKAIEVGNIFKLNDRFSNPFDLKYIDEKGKNQTVLMGCYGIGPSRVMGSVVEVYHDKNGIVWPKNVTPADVHLLQIGPDKAVANMAQKVYDKLLKAGIDVLFDDRQDSTTGQKFADADLIGIPVRLVVSAKTGEKVEIKNRNSDQAELLSLEEAISMIKK